MKAIKFVNTGAPWMASLVGHQLGPYTVIEQMGSGGMATVYRAHHPRLDRDVAIKMLHEAFQEDQNFLARFEREAQIVARLDHPHIVPVFDFDEYNGRPYLVMKYIEGQTLKAVLDKNALTLDDILKLMPPIAAALDYAHGQGVLHRDIKPSNIIIDSNSVPYLTDFGLARMAQLGESTLSQDVLLGTPHYISPEQAMGSRDLDARTDLYSLGVVLYELVVGRVPFSADTPYAVIHDHIYRELPKPSAIDPEIAPEIDTVLVKALAKNPAERYASATEMVAAFRQAIAQSNLTTLNPDRASIASESLAQFRDQQNQTAAQPQPVREPFDDEFDSSDDVESASPKGWVRVPGVPSPPGGFPRPPQPPQRPFEGKQKRVVEASFDFSNAGRAIEEAGEAVRGAIESIGETFDKSKDLDFIPMDDPEAIRRRIEQQFKKRNEFFGHLVAFVLVNALLWIIYFSGLPVRFIDDPDVTQILAFPWPAIVLLAWGSGLVAHAIETYYLTGRRATRRLQVIQSEFQRVFGSNWQHADRKELRRVRSRVQEPITKRREFMQHLSVYVLINLMLWMIYGMTSAIPGIGDVIREIPFPWPIFVTFGWGIGLVINGFQALTAGTRERAISRAVEREQDLLYGEKPKRDALYQGDDFDDSLPNVRLTQDGEFTDSMIQELEGDDALKRKRR